MSHQSGAGADFGANRQRRSDARLRVGLVAATGFVGVVVAAAALLGFARHQGAEAKADNQAWAIDGPPCPQISAAVYRSLATDHAQPFAFETLSGERAHGEMVCSETDLDRGRRIGDFPVCQFRIPVALHVRTAQGDVYFDPGDGPATISKPGGQTRCVLAANAANW